MDLRLLRNRNFAVAFLLLMVTGVVVFGTTQFIPQLLQQVLGYTATDAGMALSLGGAATVVVMPVAGYLAGRADPRLLLGMGLIIQVFAVWNMSLLDAQISFEDAALARLYSAVGLPFMFVTVTALAYVGLKPAETNQASGLMNVARNLGGTIGISLVQTLLAQREQMHQAQLTETLSPLNPLYNPGLSHIGHVLEQRGAPPAGASRAAVGELYQMVQRQADMLSFIDAFRVLMLVIVALTPLVLLMKGRPPGAPAGRGEA